MFSLCLNLFTSLVLTVEICAPGFIKMLFFEKNLFKFMMAYLFCAFFKPRTQFLEKPFIFMAVEDLWSLKPNSSLLGVTSVTK